jgi:hypothetical protein
MSAMSAYVSVDLIIYKSYNSNCIVEMSQMAYFTASVRENCSSPKIWRGRRDVNMTGGGGGGAPRKRLAAT